MLSPKEIKRILDEFAFNSFKKFDALDKHCADNLVYQEVVKFLDANPEYNSPLITADGVLRRLFQSRKPRVSVPGDTEGDDGEEGDDQTTQETFAFYGCNKIVHLGKKVHMFMSKMDSNDIIAVLQKDNKATQNTVAANTKKSEHWLKWMGLLDGDKYKTLGDLEKGWTYMTKKPSPDTHETAIEQILDSVRELLEEHYAAASRIPDDKDRIKIGFAVAIEDHEVQTTCTYGKRYKAITERHLDDPAQIKLNLVTENKHS